MPFDPPCFAPAFFCDDAVLSIVHAILSDKLVADQWAATCLSAAPAPPGRLPAAPLCRSPGPRAPSLRARGEFRPHPDHAGPRPIEIASGTHRMPRPEGLQAIDSGLGALHRGSPNVTDTPRALVTIR